MSQAPPGLIIDTEQRTEGSLRFYRGRQFKLNRRVSLVTLTPGVLSTSALARRLDREAQVLANLDHPNILRLYDYVQAHDHGWLVLEDVDGPGLLELIPRGLSWQAIAAIFLDLCRALDHAHALGHYHGSLTPKVVSFSLAGCTKLAGFGRNTSPEAETTELLDTESRGGLSPETSIGQAHSSLSDLFALGALLYEVISGRAPFGDIHAIDYPAKVRNTAHIPLLRIAPELPQALLAIIDQLLEKLPAQRPPHAAAVAEQLEGLIGNSTAPILQAEFQRLGLIQVHKRAAPHNTGLAQAAFGLDAQPGVDTGASATALGSRFNTWLRRGRAGLPYVLAVLVCALAGALVLSKRPFARDVATPSRAAALPQDQALHLRVVASPWAHVLVDGALRETTPFAQPIGLTPGSHVVRLEHPNAPAEERTITGHAGQVVLLNVQMHVKVQLPSSLPTGKVEESTP